MKNQNSSDTMAEDMLRTITQLACSESHLKTLIEKHTGDMENGVITDFEKANEKIDNMVDELSSIAELRRRMMKNLFDMYEGDASYWCQIKHLAVAAYTAFEAYQASDDDVELYDMFIEINSEFIRACSHFLGTEITQCAACFGDMLKGAS